KDDLQTCRFALQELNGYLTRHPDRRPAPPPAARRDGLRRELGLDAGDLEELDRETFTLLDGHHLDLCFLLRDAALALETRAQEGKPPPAVDEAAAAVGGVVRPVRR